MTTTAGLQLLNDVGPRQVIYDRTTDIPASENFTKGYMTGPESFYLVYDTPNTGDSNTGTSIYVSNQSGSPQSFPWPVQSANGFDKVGVVLFEHASYRGTGKLYSSGVSDVDLMESFPTPGGQGVSSMIVDKGVWSLYDTYPRNNGVALQIDGKTEFGPGTRISWFGAANDKARCLHYVRDE